MLPEGVLSIAIKVVVIKEIIMFLAATFYNNNNDRLTAFDPGQPG